MTELDIIRANNNAVVALGGASDALDRLGAWVEAARNAHQLVAPLIGTAFVPDAYRPKVDPRATPEQKREAYEMAVANATAAVLQGITLGLDPMTALQQIYIVHGRPGMYAKLMVALVQSHGHEVWTEDLTDTRAVVAGRRRGSENIERITITMDMARRAKWTSNAKYQETPQDMLWARAASRVCDRIASDVLKGIASVEQIRDEMAPESSGGTRTVAPRKRAESRVVATVEPAEPSLEPEPGRDGIDVAAAELEEPAELITRDQQKALHASLGEAGLGDRDAGLAAIAAILGRDVDSTKTLTKREASAVIDTLKADLQQPEGPALDELWPETAEVPQ